MKSGGLPGMVSPMFLSFVVLLLELSFKSAKHFTAMVTNPSQQLKPLLTRTLKSSDIYIFEHILFPSQEFKARSFFGSFADSR